jgi:drug/metabolite transporter (DMT)-like permease
MNRPVSLIVLPLLAAALLAFTWLERRDPLDLWVMGAAFVGLVLLLRGPAGQVQWAVLALMGLLTGVALYGVRQPLSALGFALVFMGVQWLVRRLLGGR